MVEIVEIIEIEVVGDLKEDCGYIEIQRMSNEGLRLSKKTFDQNDAVSVIEDVKEWSRKIRNRRMNEDGIKMRGYGEHTVYESETWALS